MDSENLIAVFGLDCGTCDIRRAPFDAEAAGRLVAWYREMGWLKPDEGMPEVMARGMYCTGCRGSHSEHWSADCEILACCVDQRRLTYCCDCSDFI